METFTMRSTRIVCVVLLLALTAAHASDFSRDESKENTITEFNLASTFKGGINTNRQYQRAQLDPQLYPDTRQQLSGHAVDIDATAAHENGGSGSGIGTIGSGQSSSSRSHLYPGQLPNFYPNQPSSSGIPPVADPSPPGVYPSYRPQPPVFPAQPPYAYPGQYLPQYPSYPPYNPYISQPPVMTHPGAPPVSYQNQQNYPWHGDRDRSIQTFKMNTEYAENGTHRGPFGVLNNHGSQGYGSGFGGAQNGDGIRWPSY